MGIKIRNKNVDKSFWIAIVLSILPRVLLSLSAVPFRTISDETATIAGSAFLAGFDWSQVVSHAGYYGSGFSALCFPIFRITDNPYVIYRMILVMAGILQGATAAISYRLMKRYFNVKNKRILCVAAIACSYMVVTRTSVVFNEHMLIFLMWVLAFLFCRLWENRDKKKKRAVDTMLLLFVLSYSLTLHTRAWTLWGALVFLVITVYWLERRLLISLPVFVVTGVVDFAGSLWYVTVIQNKVWLADSATNLRNSSVGIQANIDWISKATLKAWLGIVMGQIHTIVVITGGLALIIIVANIRLLVSALKSRFMQKKEKRLEEQTYYLILFLFFGACVAATILAQSIIWLEGARAGIVEGYGTLQYGVKAFTYVRYFGPYVGPIFMIGLCLVYHSGLKKNQITITLALAVILEGIWFACILPYIYQNSKANEPYVPLSFFRPGQDTTWMTYIPASIIFVVLLLIFLYYFYKKKYILPLFLSAVFLFYQNAYATKYDIAIAQNNSKRSDAGYAFIKEEENKIKLPKQLYVKDTTDKTDHQIFYLYQFMLNRYQIIPELPDAGIESAIIFSNSSDIEELFLYGYQVAKLDSNEYIFARGELLEELLAEEKWVFSKEPIPIVK